MTRRRAVPVVLLVLAGFGGPAREPLQAHAGVTLTDPLEGTTLGDSPTVVRLSFSELPEAALSEIRVLGTNGVAYQLGSPQYEAEDRRTLAVRVRPLERGVYTVDWRVVSAIDGHATAGVFVFGVRMPPTVAAATSTAVASRLEMAARWILIAGLFGVLGAGAARLLRFGGPHDVDIGAAASVGALLGLVLLAIAQRNVAGASFARLLKTSIGYALVGRGLAIGAAGVGFGLARWAGPGRRSLCNKGVTLAAAGGLAAVAVHAAAGHAASSLVQILSQWAHFTAGGVWLGGLAVLLIAVGGTPSPQKAEAVQRFSRLAGVALAVVMLTGLARTVNGLTSWPELVSTSYGRIVLVKIALIGSIAVLGFLNRSRSVPAAIWDLRPLRRLGGGEVALAVGAAGAAAILATLPPPASAFLATPAISASGFDFATSVRVRLTAVSDQPGPNRFVLHIRDYDSNDPIQDARVSLRFAPVDDPGIESTTLALAHDHADTYSGSGANLSFDGRWRVTALIQRSGGAVEVPMDVESRMPPRPLSIERLPGREPVYTVQLRGIALVQFAPESARAGPTRVRISCLDMITDYLPVDHLVVTTTSDGRPTEQRPVVRLALGQFVADVMLRAGHNRIVAVGQTSRGTRIRAGIDLLVQ